MEGCCWLALGVDWAVAGTPFAETAAAAARERASRTACVCCELCHVAKAVLLTGKHLLLLLLGN